MLLSFDDGIGINDRMSSIRFSVDVHIVKLWLNILKEELSRVIGLIRFNEDEINENKVCSFLVLKHGFKKVAKKSDYIRIDDIGAAFRHSGQNPTEDTIKDMIEKAKQLKKAQLRESDEDEG